MVSDEILAQFDQAVEEVLANAPSFEDAMAEVSKVLQDLGFRADPLSLRGRKILLMWATGDGEDKPENVRDVESVSHLGWHLTVTVIKDVNYNGGASNPHFNVITIDTEDITFEPDPDKPGEWTQDWWPYRGKYKLV